MPYLRAKNETMKQTTIIGIAAFLCLVSACGWLDTGDARFNSHRYMTLIPEKPGRGNPGNKDDFPDTAVFVTAVEFYGSYYWQRDTAGESEPFRICVYRNMEKILAVQGGPGTIVSYEPDMHRYVGGHLYTDFSSAGETVIGMDGQELFRYKGREMMCGFIVSDGKVYTLGQNRSGPGVTLRCDGETIFSDPDGYAIGNITEQYRPGGALHEDGGNMYFSYNVPPKGVTGKRAAVYLVENGSSVELNPPAEIQNVSDVRVADGTVYVCGNTVSRNSHVVLSDGKNVNQFQVGMGYQFAGGRVLWTGKEMYVKADCSTDMWKNSCAVMWDMSKMAYGPSNTQRIYGFYVDGAGGYASAGIDLRTGNTFVLNVRNDVSTAGCALSGRYDMMSPGCAAMLGGNFYVGLTPHGKGEKPVLVKNGTPTELKINGFISSVSVCASNQSK